MRTYTQNKPAGGDAATDWALRQQSRAQEELQFFDSPTVKFHVTTRGIRAHVRQSSVGGGNGKWRWHPGVKEHDPATAYKTDEVVFISPDSAIVSTGIVDLVSNTLTRTPPGTWIAIKDVPAQVTIAAHDAVPETIKYNVPQLLPTTGANLLDASTVYWHLLQEHNPCVGS